MGAEPRPALTPAEVALRVGSTEWYIRELCRQGVIKHLRAGRKAIRFTEAQAQAVEEYLTVKPATVRRRKSAA